MQEPDKEFLEKNKEVFKELGEYIQATKRKVAPFLEFQKSITEGVKRDFDSIVPILKETMEKFDAVKSLVKPSEMNLIITPPPRPVTYEEVEEIVEENIASLKRSNKTSTELIFTKNKELIRTVSGKQFVCSFIKNKKPISILNALTEHNDHIPTKILQKLTDSPSEEALRKSIQGINKEVKSQLKIQHPLIKGRRGFGYKINEKISVIKE